MLTIWQLPKLFLLINWQILIWFKNREIFIMTKLSNSILRPSKWRSLHLLSDVARKFSICMRQLWFKRREWDITGNKKLGTLCCDEVKYVKDTWKYQEKLVQKVTSDLLSNISWQKHHKALRFNSSGKPYQSPEEK